MAITAALRLLALALTAALSTCHAPQLGTTPRPSVAVAPPAPAPRVFDPDVVRPDPSSAHGRVAAALEEDPARALELARASLGEADATERGRIAWLGARAAERAGVRDHAIELFGTIAGTDHPLAPWAGLARARLRLEADPALAASEAASLGDTLWAGQRAARELHALALVRAERADDAEPLLRALLDEAPSDAAQASVAMPLAELYAARGAPVEAVRLWRRVSLLSPLSRAGRDAEARARTALAALSPAQRAEVGEPAIGDSMERARVIAAAQRHGEAAAAYGAIVESTEEPALRCEARLGQARALYSARERRRAAPMLATIADDCDAPEVRAWARYLAGKTYQHLDEHDRAIAQYGALEREVPAHSLADDARFRAALVDLDRGDLVAMTERLETLPEAYPAGDMHGEARFLLAWRARSEGRLEDAKGYLEASLAAGPGESAEDVRGRAAYWHATVLHELGQTEPAREAWTGLVAELPLSYYSQQAMVRLGELGPAALESARASLGARGEPAITFPWRDELDTPAFARAIELFTVGEIDEARGELRWIYEETATRDEALRWIEAALLDRVGAYSTTVYLTRRELSAFLERPPTGEHYARWRIAYPAAYAPLIDRVAEERTLPPAMVRAIAREESSFRPDAVSVAHAYGLVQLIVPTARRFGRTVGMDATAQTLTDPQVNVTIGSAFMKWLWDRYESNPAVLPSAYNAGQGATDRWLRERPGLRLDEWIEEIPYDETRRYTRRVLQSWGTYAWLDHGELPALRGELPPAP